MFIKVIYSFLDFAIQKVLNPRKVFLTNVLSQSIKNFSTKMKVFEVYFQISILKIIKFKKCEFKFFFKNIKRVLKELIKLFSSFHKKVTCNLYSKEKINSCAKFLICRRSFWKTYRKKSLCNIWSSEIYLIHFPSSYIFRGYTSYQEPQVRNLIFRVMCVRFQFFPMINCYTVTALFSRNFLRH